MRSFMFTIAILLIMQIAFGFHKQLAVLIAILSLVRAIYKWVTSPTLKTQVSQPASSNLRVCFEIKQILRIAVQEATAKLEQGRDACWNDPSVVTPPSDFAKRNRPLVKK